MPLSSASGRVPVTSSSRMYATMNVVSPVMFTRG
jgi:hypothetical protein